jgi:hypothetical protein
MTPRLQIQQTFASIGLRYEYMRLTVHHETAQLDIRQSGPRLDISQIPGRLDIDQSQAFVDEGRVPSLELVKLASARAAATLAEKVAAAAEFGEQLRRSQNPRATVVDAAMYSAVPSAQAEPALVPRPFSVHMHYTPGRLSLELRNGQVEVHATLHPPHISFTMGSVHAYLEQAASIHISVPLPGQRLEIRV